MLRQSSRRDGAAPTNVASSFNPLLLDVMQRIEGKP